jgi:hypothetical protein
MQIRRNTSETRSSLAVPAIASALSFATACGGGSTGVSSHGGDAFGDGGLTCPGVIAAPPYVNIALTAFIDTAPPAFTGGAIADGVYILTSAVEYDSVDAGCDLQINPLQAMSFQSGMFRNEVQLPPDGGVECAIAPYTINGPSVLLGADGGLARFQYSTSSDGRTLEVALSSCGGGPSQVDQSGLGSYVRQ